MTQTLLIDKTNIDVQIDKIRSFVSKFWRSRLNLDVLSKIKTVDNDPDWIEESEEDKIQYKIAIEDQRKWVNITSLHSYMEKRWLMK